MPTWINYFKKKLTQSDWMLILANLVPVYGVWLLHWDPRQVFLVYCLETIIIGIFTFLKMGITGLFKKQDDWMYQNNSVSKQPAIFFMLFFLVHYGMFVFIQMGMFFAVSGIGKETGAGFFSFFTRLPSLVSPEAGIMLSVFIASYAFKNISEYLLSGEYRTASLGNIMFQPYGRIIIQQFTVIIGSMFLTFGAGKIFILVFALIKIFFEVFVDLEGRLKQAATKELSSTRKE